MEKCHGCKKEIEEDDRKVNHHTKDGVFNYHMFCYPKLSHIKDQPTKIVK